MSLWQRLKAVFEDEKGERIVLVINPDLAEELAEERGVPDITYLYPGFTIILDDDVEGMDWEREQL